VKMDLHYTIITLTKGEEEKRNLTV
jgi:hypothetical protein